MKITLSVATSRDGAINDMSDSRLVLSSAEDWSEVYRLRSEHDAILIGAQTLREDNPTLGLKGMCDSQGRLVREPLRVIVSGAGAISPELRLFHKGDSPIIIFSTIERPELIGAQVIVAQKIDVPFIVTELEKRGVYSIFVEGGCSILNLFLNSGVVDELRVACNPDVVVGDSRAPHFDAMGYEVVRCVSRNAVSVDLGGVIVTTYSLKGGESRSSERDMMLMRRAVELADNSPQRDSCYRVGAIVETVTGELFGGYTLEGSPTHHAEQVAIYKAQAAGADLRGATIYASLEPCSQRSSEPESCSQIIMRLGFARVVFAMYEPSHFVECHGAENLRRAGVEVVFMEEFASEVHKTNHHLLG